MWNVERNSCPLFVANSLRIVWALWSHVFTFFWTTRGPFVDFIWIIPSLDEINFLLFLSNIIASFIPQWFVSVKFLSKKICRNWNRNRNVIFVKSTFNFNYDSNKVNKVFVWSKCWCDFIVDFSLMIIGREREIFCANITCKVLWCFFVDRKSRS